ncbi:hypothetical protein [Prosthecobacter sp.]|uniref:hypothetical protein n=1 Tax=Prosthecobacter sp. TaxID=1965333 RepID=UPI003784F302
MKMRTWIQAVFSLLLVSASQAQWFPEKGPLFSAEDRQRAEQQAGDTLSKAAKTEGAQEHAGRAILSGDLFADGRWLAVVESPAGLALLAWEHDAWHLLALWNLAPVWIPAGKTKNDFPEYVHILPDLPATPFQMKDLDGDAIPELIVTFNNDGYRLGYAIIKKGRGENVPQLLDVFSSLRPPQGRAGYLLTFSDSGRKAWWGETDYYRWEKGLPVHAATWHDNCYDPDKPFWAVTRHDTAQTLRISPNETSENASSFVLTQVGGDQEKDEPYAIVDVKWRPGLVPKYEKLDQHTAAQRSSSDCYAAAELCLFEKITGLPAAVFDEEINGLPVAEIAPLTKRLEIRAKGTPEAVQRLAPPEHK